MQQNACPEITINTFLRGLCSGRSLLTTLWICLVTAQSATSQVVVDASLGAESSTLSSDEIGLPNGGSGTAMLPGLRVQGGAGRGENLFHSFEQFNVWDGQWVFFDNPVGIEQILTRVTGGQPSQILGTLGVDGPANLFLLNPQGIVFGPNAQLDLKGSFAASTGSQLSFEDGAMFHAIQPETSLLTMSAPVGVRLGNALPQGDLQNQANLAIATGQQLALLGNNLLNQGSIQASGGMVKLLGNRVELLDPSLEGLSDAASLVVEANDDIMLADAIDDRFDFAPGNGEVRLTADANGDGVGAFVMDPSDSIRTFGRNLSIAGASLSLGNVDTSATPLNEAGELLATSQTTDLVTDVALTRITGQLTDPTDIDLYRIQVSGQEPFSASTVDNSPVDTRLFLFDAQGRGIYSNDNSFDCNCQQSSITATAPLAPGTHYLGVTNNGSAPQSQAGAIFPDGFETLNFSALEGPTGAGGGGALTAWNGQPVGDVGGYGIQLTGVLGSASQFSEMLVMDSGQLNLIATQGDLVVGKLTTAASGTGGDMSLTASRGSIRLNDHVNALGSAGTGGNVSLMAQGGITFGPQVFLFTDGQLSGDVDLEAGGDIVLQNGLISLRTLGNADAGLGEAGFGESGLGGGFVIVGRSLQLQDGSQIIAETDGSASLKDSRVVVQEDVLLGGFGQVNRFNPFALLVNQVGTPGTGDGGNLTLEAGQSLEVSGAAFLGTRSFGRGNAGDLTIRADEVRVVGAVQVPPEFQFEAGESVFESELGTEAELESDEILLQGGFSGGVAQPFEITEANAGDILIQARRLLVQDGGEISAGTHSRGDGGNVTLIAQEVIISGQTFGENSEVETETVPEFLGARAPEGNAGNLRIESNRLQVTDGGKISTGSLALGGNAGRLEIVTRELEVGGGFVAPDGEVETSEIVSEVLSPAEEEVQGDLDRSFGGVGGSIDITTEQLIVRDGGRISVSTEGNGPAGDLRLRANSVTLSGEFVPGGNSDEGPVTSGLFASSEVEGQAAGNIELSFRESLVLSDRAAISANTQGNQGNITATGGTLLLSNGGSITTNAGGDFTGGNITLNVDNLIATPELGNNDITANAASGSGGQIRIQTRSPILGFQVTPALVFQANNLTPATSPSNDIAAFSQFNPEIDTGRVEIEPPELDPSEGLNELPSDLVDPSDRIMVGCPASKGNRFTISRQGGLPPDPRRGLRSSSISRDIRLSRGTATVPRASSPQQRQSRVTIALTKPNATTSGSKLTEAQTWSRDRQGNIQLLAARHQAVALTSEALASNSLAPAPTYCSVQQDGSPQAQDEVQVPTTVGRPQ